MASTGLHRTVFVQMAQDAGWTRGVELGTGEGRLAAMLLAGCPALNLMTVDAFRRPGYWEMAHSLLVPYADRCQLVKSLTHDAAALVPDGSLDFTFIDAGHKYPAIHDDIVTWERKVRLGGWFGGHDYSAGHPGVKRAVDEAFGRRVQTAPGNIWWVIV
jgi:predicted O-methyltransferase YrrM